MIQCLVELARDKFLLLKGIGTSWYVRRGREKTWSNKSLILWCKGYKTDIDLVVAHLVSFLRPITH